MKAMIIASTAFVLCFSQAAYAWHSYSPPWNKSINANATVSVPIKNQDSKKQIGTIRTGVRVNPSSHKKISGTTRLTLGNFFSSFGSRSIININW